jgi:hypothetical protein
VLKIIKNEQSLLHSKGIRELVLYGSRTGWPEAERGSDGSSNSVWMLDMCKGNEKHAILKLARYLTGDLECKPGLTDPAGTGQSDKSDRGICKLCLDVA